jgi:hypothetical protein
MPISGRSAIGRIHDTNMHQQRPQRSGDDAERFAADDGVESRRTSLLPLGKIRHSFSQDFALHRDP